MRDPRLTAWRALGLASLVTAATAGGLWGQEWRDYRAARQAAGVRSLEVELRYAAGRLLVDRSDVPLLYDARVRYDAERFRPGRAFTLEGDRGRLRLAVPSNEESDDTRTRVRIDDWDVDFDLEHLTRTRDEIGSFELRLDPSVPVDLKLGVGAARAQLELGDLSLTSLTFATGASEAEVRFAEPNRVRMARLSLTSGAAEFRAERLGNARFDELEYTGAIGDVVLDFGGTWERDARARIKIAVGGLKIRLPRDLGVRIERASLLASLEADGFEQVEGAWVSSNWDSAERRLEIDLSTGFGTVQIERN